MGVTLVNTRNVVVVAVVVVVHVAVVQVDGVVVANTVVRRGPSVVQRPAPGTNASSLFAAWLKKPSGSVLPFSPRDPCDAIGSVARQRKMPATPPVGLFCFSRNRNTH